MKMREIIEHHQLNEGTATAKLRQLAVDMKGLAANVKQYVQDGDEARALRVLSLFVNQIGMVARKATGDVKILDLAMRLATRISEAADKTNPIDVAYEDRQLGESRVFMHPRDNEDYREIIQYVMDKVDDARRDMDKVETKLANAESELDTLEDAVGGKDERMVAEFNKALQYHRKSSTKAADALLQISNKLYNLQKQYKD